MFHRYTVSADNPPVQPTLHIQALTDSFESQFHGLYIRKS